MTTESHDAGTLHVAVEADTTGFGRELKKKVREATADIVASVRTEWKISTRDLQRSVRDATASVKAKVSGTVAFGAAQIRQAVKDAAPKNPPRVRVDAQFSAPQIRRAAREVGREAGAAVRVDADVRAGQLRRAVRAAAREAGATVTVGLSVSRAQKARVRAEIDRLGGTARVDLDDKGARSTLTGLRGFARGALQGALGWVISPSRWSALGAGLRSVASATASVAKVFVKGAGFLALAGGAVQALGAVRALLPALGALGVLPALGFAAAAGIGVLKFALAGVGSAIKDALSGKELDGEAFAKLSAGAQKLALAVQRLRPGLDDLRKGLSDKVLAGFDTAVTRLAGTWLPVLKVQLGSIGTEFNRLALDAIAFASSASFVADVGGALGLVGVAAGRLQFALPSILSIFQDLVAVGAQFLPGLASGFDAAANRAQAFVHQARESGQLAVWIQTGLTTLRQLGAVLVQVGGIVSSVMSAAADASGGFLGNLSLVLTKVNSFLSAGEGHQALVSFFQALTGATTAVLPVVLALASAAGSFLIPALSGLVQILAPAVLPLISALRAGLEALLPGVQILATGLGAGLKALVDTGALQVLGGALSTGLASLGSVLPLVGRALGEIVVAAAPLLPIVGDLAAMILQLAAIGLSNLARILGPVIKALAEGLHPVLEAGMRALSAWAPLVAKIAEQIGGKLGDALQRVLPKLTEVAVKIIDSLVPHLPALAELISKCADAFLEFLGPATDGLVDFIGQITAQLLPHLPELVAVFIQLALAGAKWMPLAFRLLGWALAIITPVVQAGLAFRAFGKPLLEAASAVGKFAGDTIRAVVDAWNWISGLPGRIGSGLASAWSKVTGWFSSAGQQASQGVSGIGRWFEELPGKIGGFLSELPAKAGKWLADTASEMATKFLHGVGMLIGYALALPQLIMLAINELPGKAEAFFGQLWMDVTTWAVVKLTELLVWLNGLPDRAMLAIVGLYVQAQVWWSGLWRDVSTWASNGIDSLLAWVNGLPGRAVAALSSLGALLAGQIAGAWAWAKQAAVDGINNLINFIYGIPGRISALGGQLWQAGASLIQSLLNGLSNLGGGLSNVANSIVSGIKNGLNWVIRKINEGISSVDVIPGVSLPRLPLLAQGAIVTEATTAVIGEDGPEAVIPLSKPKRAMELLRRSGLVDLLRQAGGYTNGLALAPAGGIPPLRGAPPAPAPPAAGPALRGGDVNVTLHGSRLSSDEQLSLLGGKVAWLLRTRGGR